MFISAIQTIFLLKPEQHGNEMRNILGDTLLTNITRVFKEGWTNDCPFFTKEKVSEVDTVVDVSFRWLEKILAIIYT